MKKRLVLIAVVIMSLVAVTMLYQTFASSSTVSSNDNIHTITLSGTSQINIPANSSKTIIYQITNTNKGIVQYGVIYKGDNITVRVYTTSEDESSGTVDYGENRFIKLYIKNSGSAASVATIETVLGYEHGGDLIVPSGYSLISGKYYPLEGAAQEITQLYLNNKNKVVTNNSIEYQYSESVNLMSDRLGGVTTDYDDGNIRYYGANPNNYVDIGDRTSTGEVIPYRIIGIFKDIETSDGSLKQLIKVIRDESIGSYSWDNKTNGIGSSVSDSGSNDWTDARLMMLLNPGYDMYNEKNPLEDNFGNIVYGYEGSLWWNSKSGICYSNSPVQYSTDKIKACDFTSTGLSSNVQYKIEEVVWNLGSNMSMEVYSDVMYRAERGKGAYTDGSAGVKRPVNWVGKVTLMYTSDYGYATDFNSCSKILYDGDPETALDYSVSGCYDKDWLYNGEYQWQLTSINYYSSAGVRNVGSKGNINGYYSPAGTSYYVRPTFYMDSELVIESGDGTSGNPYVLG